MIFIHLQVLFIFSQFFFLFLFLCSLFFHIIFDYGAGYEVAHCLNTIASSSHKHIAHSQAMEWTINRRTRLVDDNNMYTMWSILMALQKSTMTTWNRIGWGHETNIVCVFSLSLSIFLSSCLSCCFLTVTSLLLLHSWDTQRPMYMSHLLLLFFLCACVLAAFPFAHINRYSHFVAVRHADVMYRASAIYFSRSTYKHWRTHNTCIH